MAREILFKAKRIDNGEWVEGNLFIDEKGEKHEILIGYVNYRVAWEVDKDTICQYTGLTDKNGNKIFENDVVGFMNYEDRQVIEGVVKYGNFNCSCCSGVYGWYIDGGDIRLLNEEEGKTYLEFIGNIFDNPELLRGCR